MTKHNIERAQEINSRVERINKMSDVTYTWSYEDDACKGPIYTMKDSTSDKALFRDTYDDFISECGNLMLCNLV